MCTNNYSTVRFDHSFVKWGKLVHRREPLNVPVESVERFSFVKDYMQGY